VAEHHVADLDVADLDVANDCVADRLRLDIISWHQLPTQRQTLVGTEPIRLWLDVMWHKISRCFVAVAC
jgi:hypothetical protein